MGAGKCVENFLRLAVYIRVPSRKALSYDLASQVRRPSVVLKPSRNLANAAGLTFSMQR